MATPATLNLRCREAATTRLRALADTLPPAIGLCDRISPLYQGVGSEFHDVVLDADIFDRHMREIIRQHTAGMKSGELRQLALGMPQVLRRILLESDEAEADKRATLYLEVSGE